MIMQRVFCCMLAVTFAACAGKKRHSEPERSALVVRNLKIPNGPLAAIRIEDGVITHVGPNASIAVPGTGAVTLDAQGGLLLPGLMDPHIHLVTGALTRLQLRLSELKSVEEAKAALSQYAQTHSQEKWVQGRGWQYDWFEKGEHPKATTLDEVVGDRPVALRSYDGHALWVNTQALMQAGITKDTPDPKDGTIVRDSKGNPTGSLLEGAMSLVMDNIPEPTTEQRLKAMRLALDELSSLGITRINDITKQPGAFEWYHTLHGQGDLPMRVSVSLPLDGDLDAYSKLRAQYTNEWIQFGCLKTFLDGVIEAKTAYMLEDYEGGGGRGKPLVQPKEFERQVKQAQEHGFPVCVHAIGTAAVRLALDTFEKLLPSRRPGAPAHSIEHIEVLHPDDAKRFAKIGVVASMQPYHANPFNPTPNEGVWSENLGAKRLPMTFAWRTLLDAGATLQFGSDWPVMSADPLKGLAVAMTRQTQEGEPPGGWNAHQAVTMEEAIAAYSGGTSGEERTIKPGIVADFVVLSPTVDLKDPSTLWDEERVSMVFVGGNPVFCRHETDCG